MMDEKSFVANEVAEGMSEACHSQSPCVQDAVSEQAASAPVSDAAPQVLPAKAEESLKAAPEREDLNCPKCGAALGEDMNFCPKCGASRNAKSACVKCGAELAADQEFCHKCGHKVGAEAKTKAASLSPNLQRLAVVICIAVIAAVSAFVFWPPKIEKIDIEKASADLFVSKSEKLFCTVVPEKASKRKLNWTSSDPTVATVTNEGIVEGVKPGTCTVAAECDGAADSVSITVKSLCQFYLEQAMYKEALNAASSEEEIKAVLFENLCAAESGFAGDALKNPASFALNDAYYDAKNDMELLVMNISGTNGYGGVVSSYWLFSKKSSENWEYLESVSDLEHEEYKSWDEYRDMLKKDIRNSTRHLVTSIITKGSKLTKDGIKRINKLYAEGKLDKVPILSRKDLKNSPAVSKNEAKAATETERKAEPKADPKKPAASKEKKKGASV